MKRQRELLTDAALETRLHAIEKTLLGHNSALREVIQKLRPLLLPPPDPPKPRIGFHRGEDKIMKASPLPRIEAARSRRGHA